MGGAFIRESDSMKKPKPRARCAAYGKDPLRVGRKPVRLIALPAGWQLSAAPQAALARMQTARAQRLLCARCARAAAASGGWALMV